jgi:hypothetical protein
MAHKASPADDIRKQILSGTAPGGLRVSGKLSFSEHTNLTAVPEDLTVGWLDLTGCTRLASLPRSLHARRLTLQGRWDPSHLLHGLRCYHLELQETTIESLPADMQVEHRLDLSNCTSLRSLPEGLKVGSLVLQNCTSLEHLPEGLSCYFLDLSGCTAIAGWPERASVSVGRLSARGCHQLKSLPAWLTSIAQLDLRDCRGISTVPDGLSVSSWIDVAGTGIRSLPKSLDHVQLRWRGVPIDARIAFLPETITREEVLAEGNAEKRRVLLERMGYERFLTEARAETLDTDRDPGGERRLLRVPLKDDEPLVCVSVFCPSTGRQYIIRVPPTMTTCHQAVAWVAGFDDPALYKPLAET